MEILKSQKEIVDTSTYLGKPPGYKNTHSSQVTKNL
jgi:hypothetical protein